MLIGNNCESQTVQHAFLNIVIVAWKIQSTDVIKLYQYQPIRGTIFFTSNKMGEKINIVYFDKIIRNLQTEFVTQPNHKRELFHFYLLSLSW